LEDAVLSDVVREFGQLSLIEKASRVGFGFTDFRQWNLLSGDTWTWNGEATRNGKTILLRFTMKWTSKDSFDFKNGVGPNADSMQVMMDGKETRVTPPAAKSAAK
jgi:hypothetical protein